MTLTPQQICDIEECKAKSWRGLSTAARRRLADCLTQYARKMRPDWPTAADREADFEAHVRLSEKLRAAGESPLWRARQV